jgi:peptide/nickel transport system permease protein
VANDPDTGGVVLLVFFLFKYFGGDPAEILGGLNATPEQIIAIRQQLGPERAGVGAAGHLHQADRHLRLGQELGHQRGGEQPVRHAAAGHADGDDPILVLDVLLALPIAMWVAYRRGSLTDRTIMVVTTVALSISFLVYVIVGQYLFGFQLGWFPVQGWSDSLWTNLTPTRRCRCCWR